MNEWADIKSAPRNATEVLVYQPATKEQFVAFWSKQEGRWQFAQDTYLRDEPTHWMPLPDAPKDSK